jgi:hypothetical protein
MTWSEGSKFCKRLREYCLFPTLKSGKMLKGDTMNLVSELYKDEIRRCEPGKEILCICK